MVPTVREKGIIREKGLAKRRKKAGIFVRKLMDEVFPTTSEYLDGIIKQFIKEYEPNTDILDYLGTDRIMDGNKCVWEFNKTFHGSQWILGHVFLYRMNDQYSRIVIESMEGFDPINVEDDTLYWGSIELLTRFARYVKLLFNSIKKNEIDRLVTPQPHRKRGRPHLPEDLWAYYKLEENPENSDQIYNEWLNLPEVLLRDLSEPDKQFTNIKSEGWLEGKKRKE